MTSPVADALLHGMVRRDGDGRIHVTVPAGECPDCDGDLRLSWSRTGVGRRKVNGCPVHERAVQLSDEAGNTVTVREPGDGNAPDAAALKALGRDMLNVRSQEPLFRMVGVARDPKRWLVTATDPAAAQSQMVRALSWAVTQNDAETMGRYVAHGIADPRQAAEWAAAPFSLERARQWLDRGVSSVEDARAWKDDGYDPDMVPKGFTRLEDWKFVERVGWGEDPAWVPLRAHASPEFVREGLDLHKTIEGIRALADALTATREPEPGHRRDLLVRTASRRHYMVWSAQRSMEFVSIGQAFWDCGWEDAALCLRAGMSVPEAAAHLREGRDMEPVRLLAALT